MRNAHHILPGLLNVSWKRIGGLTFIRLGRITISFSVSKAAPMVFEREPEPNGLGMQY